MTPFKRAADKQRNQPLEERCPKKLLDQVRDGTCLLAVRRRLDQPLQGVSDTVGCNSSLPMVAQHQLLRIPMIVTRPDLVRCFY
jgi:hypothetical protein